ncbi:uncharacterized protein LOC111569526 [Amphiprion ocellaris]|uniref:uncharacterized protein LOC111569526 n=1 Tax=Amphiprion ocellaris TaxID=80972 RepID=UPI002411541C|nr:uncharacterized protein LOC111569526 [Amphiprion ocellaris]
MKRQHRYSSCSVLQWNSSESSLFQQTMIISGLSLHLVVGHLLISHVGSTCIPAECLSCNVTGEALADACELCLNITHCINGTLTNIPQNCRRDFKVFVNSSRFTVQEGEDIYLTCVHNLPDLNVTFKWYKNTKELKGENESTFSVKRVLSHNAGTYSCSVTSPCGCYKSSPRDVTIPNSAVVIWVVCGVSALVLILMMGLAMKFKLRRDNIQHRERMQQRAQIGQTLTPRGS